MANPLKKTMVFLGLAEEDLDEHGRPIEHVSNEAPVAAAPAAKPVQRAAVTPLRKVAPARAVAEPTLNEILTVHPTEYADATVVAESFRDGVPVILNLSRMNESEAKRLIDFSSGLVMGLHGTIERVTSKVFLLSPEHVALSNGEAARVNEEDTFFVTETD